ncbi:MAG: hypothetical protein NE328_19585 [Lentisphaeraceae bacterium]|nr:hypothetical protein [Lentisphaeraceae bacterium]
MIRSTTGATYDLLKSNFVDIQSEFRKRQVQASTGKEYMDRSENVSDASEVANLLRDKSDIQKFQDNIIQAKAHVMATEDRVQDIVELMQRANELLATANNGTHPPEYRQDVAQEINGIIEQVFSISESKFGDNFLFGGTQSALSPFTATRDAEGQITAVTSNADVNTEQKKSQINENTVINYGLMAAGTDGVFAASGGVDIMANLIALRDELALGDMPSSANAVQLEANMDHVIGQLTTNAVKQQWFESQESRLLDVELNKNVQLEDLQSADLGSVMIELAQLQTTYQATMQMISKTNTLSIINYI